MHTCSILPFGQSESLYLQRNQLDPQLGRHHEQTLRFALEALSISRCEQLLMGHQTWVSFIWEEEDGRQGQSHSQCYYCSRSELPAVCCLSYLSKWSYWHTMGRRAAGTHEQSAWWRRKDSSSGDKKTGWSWFRNCFDQDRNCEASVGLMLMFLWHALVFYTFPYCFNHISGNFVFNKGQKTKLDIL